jgi:hypothetical protein
LLYHNGTLLCTTMDPASAIAGLIGLAATILPPVLSYISKVKNAPKTVQSLADEINLLENMLTRFSESGILKDRSFDKSSVFFATVEACKTSLEDLRKTLSGISEGKRRVELFRRFRWPMDEGRTRESVVSLHRYTALFSFSLTEYGL